MNKQEAIALIREVSNYMATRPEIDEAVDMAIEALTNVQNMHKGNWIPVSERLPEHTGDVLVTVGVNRHGLGMYDEIRVATWNTVYRYFYVHEREDVICGEIIAWQPLPEIYRPEGENK